MDSKKPNPDPSKTGSDLKKGSDSGSRPAESAGSSSRPRNKPVLTERQRAEARRQRQKGRRHQAAKKDERGNLLSRGMRATGAEVQRTLLFLGRSVLSGLDYLRPVGGIVVRALLAFVTLVASGIRLIGRGIGIAVHAIGQACLALDRLITPRRAIAVVAMAAAGLLVASQFVEYRATEIGQPGYVAVETITHAPRVEQMTPVDSHSFLLLAAGLIAFAAATISLFRNRRQAGIILAAAGGLTIIVALAIDLPKALDVSEAELSYAGVKAVLLSGFWLELGAGAVLAVTGLATLIGAGSAPATARQKSRTPRAPVGSRA